MSLSFYGKSGLLLATEAMLDDGTEVTAFIGDGKPAFEFQSFGDTVGLPYFQRQALPCVTVH